MSDKNVLKAKISNKISTGALATLIVYAIVILAIVIWGFAWGGWVLQVGDSGYKYIGWFTLWFRKQGYGSYASKCKSYPGYIALFIFIMLVFILLPTMYLWISYRKRKLSELSVTDTEVLGYYTSFIPFAKKSLRMPAEKIDNISVSNNFFYLFTGKAIKIRSASSVIKIPYVTNTDEIVTYIMDIIEKSKVRSPQDTAKPNSNQPDYIDSLRQLAELKDAGIITEEEYNKKKSELLSKI